MKLTQTQNEFLKDHLKNKSNNFIVILYPDDPCHVNMMDYLKSHTYVFRYVAILHDHDIYSEDDEAVKTGEHVVGEFKKDHWHVLIHTPTSYTLSSFLKFFHVWINYAQPCHSVPGTLLYFLHETPDSMGKYHYSVSELFGDQRMIKHVQQNSHFVQLGDILSTLSDHSGSMYGLLSELQSNGDEAALDVIKQYQSLLCTASNQLFNFNLHYHFNSEEVSK